MWVNKFSPNTLAVALSNQETPPQIIIEKTHYRYFLSYLGVHGLNARRIVIEEEYNSIDYLLDYQAYYSRCFHPYDKYCKRVHFFSNSFSKNEFEKILLGERRTRTFWDSYLGFIVVKPLPITVIGYSLLRPYPHGNDFNKRNFWGLRDYKIHLWGENIELESLAFQEQDSVVAACASTAIWTMLNKASIDFHALLKSPYEITRDAGTESWDGSRLFPNKGLDVEQICHSIFMSGLVSEVKKPDMKINIKYDEEWNIIDYDEVISHQYLKKILNAYSSVRIPIILIIDVSGDNMGLHAITVSGFKKLPPTVFSLNEEMSLLSDKIEKFYAHDDQYGPFVRILFSQNNTYGLITEWMQDDPNQVETLIKTIIVPVYHKIRISYEDVENIVLGLDRIFSFSFNGVIKDDLVWDIQVTFSSDYKVQIKKSELDCDYKRDILNTHLPKYIWLAKCYISKVVIFDFIFDATSIAHSMFLIKIVNYYDDPPIIAHKTLKKNISLFQDIFHCEASRLYVDFLLENLCS